MRNRFLITAGFFLFFSRLALGVEFQTNYVDNEFGDFESRGWMSADSLFQRNIEAALDIYGSLLVGDEIVQVEVIADRDVLRAGGTFTFGDVHSIDSDERTVLEPGALTRLNTGDNPGISETFNFDVQVLVDPDFVDTNYWFDTNPETRLTEPPSGKTDFVWIVLHELGHGLGMAGLRDQDIQSPTYGEFTQDFKSLFDSLTTFESGDRPENEEGQVNLLFEGSEAESILGSPVPITNVDRNLPLASQNFYHLGDCGSEALVVQSLMNGCSAPSGRAHMTELDIAVFRDLGYPMASLHASFSDSDQMLKIPFLVVADQQVYSISLLLSNSDSLEFTLAGAAEVPLAAAAPARIEAGSDILTIPLLEVELGGQTSNYSAELQIISQEVPILLRVLSAVELAP